MPPFLVTYDLPPPDQPSDAALLDRATGHGWSEWIPLPDGRRARLPARTLFGSFADGRAAEEALDAARLEASLLLGREVQIVRYALTTAIGTRGSSDVIEAANSADARPEAGAPAERPASPAPMRRPSR